MELRTDPFFYVLKAGLWGEVPESPQSISQTDWIEILKSARAHSLMAIVADGASLLTSGNKPSLQIIADLASAEQTAEKGNEIVDVVLRQTAAFWEKQDVTAVLLKGRGLAWMYANPSHRTPGDIDWYFPGKENFSRAVSLVKAKGIVPMIDGDGDLHYTVNGVIVEHHRKWCDLSSPFKRGRIAEIENEFGYSRGSDYAILAPLTNLIQLNVHILKHMLVMGVGWRQLCDLALATRHYCGQYSTQEYIKAVKELGLMKWSRLLYGVLADYLGTDCAWMPVTPMTGSDVDQLANVIMDCGNFGRESGKRMFGSYASSAFLLCRYVPGEVLWRPVLLAINRLGQLIRR